MTPCLFVSDLHGHAERYQKLWRVIDETAPKAVFLGGDLTPTGLPGAASHEPAHHDFVNDYLAPGFERLRERLGDRYPSVFLILGNDDSPFDEPAILDRAEAGLWTYAHNQRCRFGPYDVFGYAHVPPSPFLNKDWERYDVSRYVPPGGVSPEEGYRSIPLPANGIRYATIEKDLASLAGEQAMGNAVFLFHAPPYETCLDRVANDGKMIDSVPLDLHVGSIAIRRFIKRRQPLLTLHGHIHESARLSGAWRERIGQTWSFGAAHDGPELALVEFDLSNLPAATRRLL